jgi:hypothetical protein
VQPGDLMSMLTQRFLLAVAAAGVLIMADGAAIAQRDGAPPIGQAATPLVTTACGPLIASVIKTQNDYDNTVSPAFSVIPGAETIVIVPPGKNYCVRVKFTAEASCLGYCYVLAVIGGTQMNPAGSISHALASNDVSAAAHSFEWVLRRGPGTHVVRIFWRTQGDFEIDD